MTLTVKTFHEIIIVSGVGLRSSAPGQRLGRQLQDCGSTTYPLFDMLECSPNWDYAAGGGVLLLVASGMDAKLAKETCERVQVMFDETQVCLLYRCASVHAFVLNLCHVHSAVSDLCVQLYQTYGAETQRLLRSCWCLSVYLLARLGGTQLLE